MHNPLNYIILRKFWLVILVKRVVESVKSNKIGLMETIHAQKGKDLKWLNAERNIKKIQFKVGCMILESCATLLKTQQTS